MRPPFFRPKSTLLATGLSVFLWLAAGREATAQTLVGASDGLYRMDSPGRLTRLLDGTDVRKIVPAGEGGGGYYFLTGRGILFSADLASFEERNTGFPVKTLKTFDAGAKSFLKEVQELKDLEIDPYNPANLVTCTKDQVFVSVNGGRSWTSSPTPAPQPGMKAVAITSKPELLVFAAHSIKGTYVRTATGSWKEIGGDLGKSDPSASTDEVSDIVVEAGRDGPLVWAANSFLPRLYRYDFSRRAFVLAYGESADFAAFDSLQPRADGLLYVTDGAVMKYDPATRSVSRLDAETAAIRSAAAAIPGQVESWHSATYGSRLTLSELWLVSFKSDKPHRAAADGRHGLYLQTGFMVQPASRAKYDRILTERGLDTIVVDLKDDYGRLRYEPEDALVASIGRSVNPLDVEGFVAEMKAKGRYLVARIVVFKDQRLHEYKGGVYAIKDGREGGSWRGYELVKKQVPLTPEEIAAAAASSAGPVAGAGGATTGGGSASSAGTAPAAGAAPAVAGTPSGPVATPTRTVTERQYYGEYWVDPYSEKVWEYNVAIAREIIARGFDEVQFDYIRFPTDGTNLGDARYSWKDAGMDMESALMSFLAYARSHIDAPISIDIYGANGWYRSGVRTGQDVELLARYVDAICPMFYPSHFEQGFMAQAPAEQRPYRIYKIGTLRNSYIARKKVVVRPYVQAFYLNVSYDRKWYSPAYVALEVDGVRDASNEGLLYWNNSGRYDDIPVILRGPDRRIVRDGGVRGSQLD